MFIMQIFPFLLIFDAFSSIHCEIEPTGYGSLMKYVSILWFVWIFFFTAIQVMNSWDSTIASLYFIQLF